MILELGRSTMTTNCVTILLRTELESSIDIGDSPRRIVLVNDRRIPVDEKLIVRYGLHERDIYDLYDFIEANKKQLIKGYLDTIDQFHLNLRRLIPNTYYTGNILFHDFASKRTDIYDSFKYFCITSLRDELADEYKGKRLIIRSLRLQSPLKLSLLDKIRLIFIAGSFLMKMIAFRTMLLFKRPCISLDDTEVVFYTQLPRQRGRESTNVNYGRVLDVLHPRASSKYLLSALTDGVHDGPRWRDLWRRSSVESDRPGDIWLMERVIDVSLISRTASLYLHYVWTVLFLVTPNRLAQLTDDEVFIFRDEFRPTVRRYFNYAYTLELSLKLSKIVSGKVFIYYLFDHNYGKLLSFHLHDHNVTLGCQHGTLPHLRPGQYFTQKELETTRFPHFIIAEGENHKESLNWIHPDVQVEVLGAPRTDALAQVIRNKHQKVTIENSDHFNILVPMSLHGNLGILDYVVEGINSDVGFNFYVKPHPAAGYNQEIKISKYLESFGISSSGGGYSIYGGDVYDLLGCVRYVLFEDTSVGIEFTEAGAVPICVEPDSRLNLSPLIDIDLFRPESSLKSHYLSRPSQLRNVLNRKIEGENIGVPKNFFFANFGDSTEHWKNFVLEHIFPRDDIETGND